MSKLGPLTYEPSIPSDGFNGFWILDKSRKAVATVDGPQNEETEAAARLFAAAPELLGDARRNLVWQKHLRQNVLANAGGSVLMALDLSISATEAFIAKAENG